MSQSIDPSILFFILGVIAGKIGSNLEIPSAISKFLSLYLLMALGLKGGFALAQSGLTHDVIIGLSLAIVMAVIVPIVAYFILKKFMNPFDALGMSATYGSVSAVTFITATQYLEQQLIPYGGYLSASLAVMESPAIIIAIILATRLRSRVNTINKYSSEKANNLPTHTGLVHVLKDAVTDGAQLVLMGSLMIGIITGINGQAVMQPFVGDLFKGMLAFFLLDMGLLASRHFPKLRDIQWQVLAYSVIAPFCHALLALLLSIIFQLPLGDTILLMVLSASASYIAVPAVLRESLPEANASLYFGLALGVTFPLNIILGIPIYHWLATVYVNI